MEEILGLLMIYSWIHFFVIQFSKTWSKRNSYVGKLSPKVHKLKKLSLKKNEKIILKKRHPLKANMSTRTLYAGKHLLELQINGSIVYSKSFVLEKVL